MGRGDGFDNPALGRVLGPFLLELAKLGRQQKGLGHQVEVAVALELLHAVHVERQPVLARQLCARNIGNISEDRQTRNTKGENTPDDRGKWLAF